MAGVVVGVAGDVQTVKPGDRVCALCGHGGLAEFVCVDAARTFVIPSEMPFEVGATLMMTYGTTLHGLVDRAGLAAAGGIGTAAIPSGSGVSTLYCCYKAMSQNIDYGK